MPLGDRERVLGRIRQIGQTVAGKERPRSDAGDPPPDRLDALEVRLAHLERLLEGLQDAVHRESERYDRVIAELQAKIDPGAMGAALAEDERNRGL